MSSRLFRLRCGVGVLAILLCFTIGTHAAVCVRTGDDSKAKASAPADPSKAYIDVTIVDEAGKPVSGIHVNTGGVHRLAADVISDQNGGVRLNLEKATPRYQTILAWSSDRRSLGMAEVKNEYGVTTRKPLRIVLSPAKSVNVSVTDKEGKPIADASVIVQASYIPVAEGKTDAAGKVTLLYPKTAAVRTVIAFKSKEGLDYFENYQQRLDRSANRPLAAQIDLKLTGAKSVIIRAKDAKGKNVPGVVFFPLTISKAAKLDGINLSQITACWKSSDAEGLTDFDWIPTSLSNAPYFYISPRDSHITDNQLILGRTDADGERVEDIVANVVSKAQIHGRLRFPDGKSAPGILIVSETKMKNGSTGSELTRTNADGIYSIAVHPGVPYMVGIQDANWTAPTRSGLIAATLDRLSIDFELIKGTLFHGKVSQYGASLNADKSLILSEFIPLLKTEKEVDPFDSQRPRLFRSVECDEQGNFQIRLSPGNFQVTVPSGTVQKRENFTITTTTDLERNYHFENQTMMTIRGNVVEAGTLRPIANARVDECEYLGSARLNMLGPYTAMTDKDGSFELKVGANQIVIYVTEASQNLGAILIAGPGKDKLDIELQMCASISGRVVDEKLKPLSARLIQCDATIQLPDDRIVKLALRTQCDEHGQYVFNAVPVGAKFVFFTKKSTDMKVGTPSTGSKEQRISALGQTKVPDLVLP